METRIQLLHPAGKKAVTMDSYKYETLKKAILNYIKIAGECTHDELFKAIKADFKENNTAFEGSVEWHMEWVKLDLEARKEIKRAEGKSPVKLVIS